MRGLWTLVLVAGCRGCPSTPEATTIPMDTDTPRLDVVIVTLDTVRADRLGAWGYAKARTETLDALAASGRRYARAYTPVPLTLPSHATIFTGLEPWHHGVRSNGEDVLAPEVVTLAERLSDAGYATAASVGAFVTTRRWGLDQGFDAYFDTMVPRPGSPWAVERPADAVVDDALGWWSSVPPDRPRFLWVHLYDAHHPWRPPAGYLDPDDPRPYDGEIAWLDDQVGRLVEGLGDRPRVLMVVGDHGESLGQHGEREHGLFVFEATQHVPWILLAPGVGGEVVDDPVALTDVVPTVLDAVGLAQPAGLDGAATTQGDRVVAMGSWGMTQRFGTAPHRAVVQGALKLIDTPDPSLFDVVSDPEEAVDLAADRPTEVARLRALVPDGLREVPTRNEADLAVDQQLAALGYVSGPVFLVDDAPDPRTRGSLVEALGEVERQVEGGAKRAALTQLEALAIRWPEVRELAVRRAALLHDLGRDQDALDVILAALERWPEDGALRLREAAFLALVGRVEDASKALTELANGPGGAQARAMAVEVWWSVDPARAIQVAEDLLRSHPGDAAVRGALGVALLAAGRAEDAWPHLEAATSADRVPPEVHRWLGLRALWQGDPVAALDHLAEEVANHPSARSASAWAGVALQTGRPGEARRAAQAWVAADPGDASAWHALALAAFNEGDRAASRDAVDRGLALDAFSPDLLLMDANLLAAEGRADEGARRFAEAKAARQARQDGLQQPVPAPGDVSSAGREGGADGIGGWLVP